jgi:hypothetical protein
MRFLYRYYGNLDYVLDTIANKRLYFSSPTNFEDPFDCRPKFTLFSCKREPDSIWEKYFRLLAKERYPSISDVDAGEHAKAAVAKGSHRDKCWLRETDEAMRNSLIAHVSNERICCFSRSPRNSMMWAHYADNHRGLVLQFKATEMTDPRGSYKGFDVEYYSHSIPLSRYVEAMASTANGDDVAFSRLMLCSKSCEWRPEEEVRFFSRAAYVPYPETMLTGILFGSECSVHWKAHVYQALSEWSSKPSMFDEDSVASSIKLCFKRARKPVEGGSRSAFRVRP